MSARIFVTIIIITLFVISIHYSNSAHALVVITQTGPWPEHMIAYDNNVYLLFKDRVGNLFFKRSIDNGASFEDTVKIGSNAIVVYESTDMAVSGNHVYVAWDHYTSSSAILFRRSMDNATSFDDAIVLSNKTGGSKLGKLAASDNYVYVVYSEGSDKYDQIILRRSADNGKTFEEPIVLNDAKRSAVGLNMAVSDSNVYVVWFQDLFCAGDVPEPNCEPSIVFRKSLDNGKTFADAITIPIRSTVLLGGFPPPPPEIVASGNNVYISWLDIDRSTDKGDILLAKSDGNDFNVINLTNEERSAWETPRIITSGSNVYVFWQTFIEEGTRGVILSRSTDYGSTFEKIKIPYNFTSSFNMFRQISLSDNKIYFVWSSNDKVFLGISRDNGSTFSKPLVFSADEFPIGYIAASGNNVYLLAFSSNFPVSEFEAPKEKTIFKRSVDGGRTFGETIVLKHDSTLMPKLNINSIILGEPEILTGDLKPYMEPMVAGKSIAIQSQLTNTLSENIQFAYILQVKDGQGFTVELLSMQGQIKGNESFNPGLGWRPDEAGMYEVEIFVWSDLAKPIPLAPSRTITLTVS